VRQMTYLFATPSRVRSAVYRVPGPIRFCILQGKASRTETVLGARYSGPGSLVNLETVPADALSVECRRDKLEPGNAGAWA